MEITCPRCAQSFEPTELIRSQLEATLRQELEGEMRVQVARAAEEAGRAANQRVTDVERELAEARGLAESATRKEAEHMRQVRVLTDRLAGQDVEIERRVAEEAQAIRRAADLEAEERHSRNADERLRAMGEELGVAREAARAAASREADLLRRARELDARETQVAVELERRLAEEARGIRAAAEREAEERHGRLASERCEVIERDLAAAREQVARMRAQEADLAAKERALADRVAQAEVEIQKRLLAEREGIHAAAQAAAAERVAVMEAQQRHTEAEHRVRMDQMQRTVDELQRRVTQGSQQIQGEAQEADLRDLLADHFVRDEVVDVPTGMNGADLLQRIHDAGMECGSIIWESKRTKAWSDGWPGKLRDDQRETGALCAVIVTQTMPPGFRRFGQIDGTWVCSWDDVVPLAAVLRAGLVELAAARRAAEGRSDKMAMLYEYLTGPEFRNRVSGVVEALREMQEDLARERSAMQRIWKKREKQLLRAFLNLSAVFGDLQGIGGSKLEGLRELELLPAGDGEDADMDEGEEDAPDEDEGEVAPALAEFLLAQLPADGRTVGNGPLRQAFLRRAGELGVEATDADYRATQAYLVAAGQVRRGKGRGGSLARRLAPAAVQSDERVV